MFKPTNHQQKGIDLICHWNCHPIVQTFSLGGFAGTGKTSLIPHVREQLSYNSVVVTYTNKAAARLREVGITDATTIFRLMYKLVDEHSMIWRKNEFLDCDLIIVDEASMLGRNIRDDLESYGIPVLYVGDPFQLPPIKEESVMDKCDYTLTEVLRHGDKILDIATAIREGRKYEDVDQWSLTNADLAAATTVICHTNDRRHQLNQRIRKHHGLGLQPEKGDRVMSAKTNYDWGIFAGELGTLVGTNHGRRWEVLFDGWADTVVFTNGYFLKPGDNPYSIDLKGRSCLDYGYVNTAHKAQGSQFDTVIVWEEARCDARWMYTAVTRAVKDVTVGGK